MASSLAETDADALQTERGPEAGDRDGGVHACLHQSFHHLSFHHLSNDGTSLGTWPGFDLEPEWGATVGARLAATPPDESTDLDEVAR